MNTQMIGALLKRDPETARRITEILGLPNDHWSGAQIVFGHDEVAHVTLSLLVSPAQLAALAACVTAVGEGTPISPPSPPTPPARS